MHLTAADLVIIALSLAGIAVFGALRGGRQTSARDYFLSETAVPWWAVCIAIVATETSALTFLSLPGVAYATNISFLQLAIGYILGRIIVSAIFLPRYFDGRLETAYTYLERRFGLWTRRSASVVFLGTRLFADGVRLYATAIPVALFLRGAVFPAGAESYAYIASIGAIALLTMFYVYLGGVRAVIWADVLQFGIYMIGALFSLVLLLHLLGDQLAAGMSDAWNNGKFLLFDPLPSEGFFTKPYTTPAGIAGGMFLSMASHGTDHLIIQRVLTTNNLAASRRAMISSGVIVFFQFAVFLFLGTLLWIHYGGAAQSQNEVFSRFILEELPTGMRGLIVAGILAAAMSTLSGSISALSASTMLDLIAPFRRRHVAGDSALRMSRFVSVLWCVALSGSAALFIGTPNAVVELALSIASFTYGGLLGVYLTGVFMPRAREKQALIGFFTAIVAMTAVISLTDVAWTWYVLIGSMICMIAAAAAGIIFVNRPGEEI